MHGATLKSFEKRSNKKFLENPSSGSRVVPWRTDRQGGPNIRFSEFCERA